MIIVLSLVSACREWHVFRYDILCFAQSSYCCELRLTALLVNIYHKYFPPISFRTDGTCGCPFPYYGSNCENTDWCLNNPCIHGTCASNADNSGKLYEVNNHDIKQLDILIKSIRFPGKIF